MTNNTDNRDHRVGSYRFGSFVFDISKSILQNDLEQFSLPRKQFEILYMLVVNAGQVVNKEEFLSQIWPEQDVEESNLAIQIHLLRRIIEPDLRNPVHILTVPSRGYTMVGEVTYSEAIPESVIAAGEVTATTDRRAPRRFPKLNADRVVAIVATLAFVATLVYFLSPKTPQSIAKTAPLTTLVGAERYPAISPDGKLIAFTWDGDQLKNDDIYIQQTSGSKLLRITTDPGSEIQPSWSRDGQNLAFLRGDLSPGEPYHLVIVPVFGGLERDIGRVSGGLDWSPDDLNLAVTKLTNEGGHAAIFLISVNGQTQRQITQPSPIGNSFDSSPRFSPDGQTIAFLRRKNAEQSDVFITSLATGKVRQLTNQNQNIQDGSLYWDVDGKSLLFISLQSNTSDWWGLTQIGLNGDPPKFFQHLNLPKNAYTLNRRALTYSFSHQQNMVAFANELEDDQIQISDFSGSSAKPCTINSTRSDTTPQLSPDGSKLVFSSTRSGSSELWLARSDCSDLKQLTNFNESTTGNPRWSPDGTRIVFDHRRSDRNDVYVINADRTIPIRVTESDGHNSMPFWSADGEWIYFTSNRTSPNRLNQIWKSRVTGGPAVQVSNADDAEKWRPQLSPDGKNLYFVRNNQLWLQETNSGREYPIQELSNLQFNCNWELNGDAIYYYQNSTVLRSVIYKLDLTTRKISQLATIEGELTSTLPSLTISGDGRRFAVSAVYLRLSDINAMTNWK